MSFSSPQEFDGREDDHRAEEQQAESDRGVPPSRWNVAHLRVVDVVEFKLKETSAGKRSLSRLSRSRT